MPRCGCQDTCSCLIVPGPGMTIDGIGTLDRPYVISSETATLNERLTFQDTTTVDFTVGGAGTADFPLQVQANATVRMSDLSDVRDTSPVIGDVPVWKGDHWEFEPQSGGGGGGGTGADEVVIASTTPPTVGGNPELWVDLSLDAFTGDPALPAPGQTAVLPTFFVTSLTEVETASQVRITVTNPHPTKRMLVRIDSAGVFEQTNTIGANETIFSSHLVASGTPVQIGTTQPFRVAVTTGQTSSDSSYVFSLYWIPPTGSATFGLTAWRTNGSATVQVRNIYITATPIRYE